MFGYSRGAALARKFVSTLLRKGVCQQVRFFGVFDTAAALDGVQRPGEDIATDVVFEDGTLHEGVKRAVHIVALDEDRLLFRPTLINKDTNNPERITEDWFPASTGTLGAATGTMGYLITPFNSCSSNVRTHWASTSCSAMPQAT